MTPAGERLDSDDFVIRHPDLRLEEDVDLAARQRSRQVGVQTLLCARAQRLDMADDGAAATFDADVMGMAFALHAVREAGRVPVLLQPVDRTARRPSPVGIELAEQVHQRNPLALLRPEASLARQRGAEFDRRRPLLPAPRLPGRGGFDMPRTAGAGALAIGKPEHQVERLDIRVAPPELRRAGRNRLAGRAHVLVVDEREERAARAFRHRAESADRFHAGHTIVTRVDERDPGSGAQESLLDALAAARRDRTPSGTVDRVAQRVALAERQDEDDHVVVWQVVVGLRHARLCIPLVCSNR